MEIFADSVYAFGVGFHDWYSYHYILAKKVLYYGYVCGREKMEKSVVATF